ncbi:MAG: glutamate--cysteine ligase [Gammaproteobacteria bacterium]|nr:glutamate--cysteine ligase [Gammaproteobacteria bacterium]MBL7000040.1 glutamate--cysteine ligase [Gammaproteobacteria bacterium]
MNSQNLSTVPHLITANSHPIEEIERHILARQDEIELWFRQQFNRSPAPFYASVDLRNAGFKLAPVDTNLFPAGFNNLNPASKPLCIQAIQITLERFCPEARGIMIVPENHTRNLFYLENVATIQEYISLAGYRCALGTLREDITTPTDITLPSGRAITLYPIVRNGDQISIGDFIPCAIVLNNDLSGGRPKILEKISQTLIPPLDLGWTNRFKSDHFQIYDDVANSFAELIKIDPWLINPLFTNCGAIDFMKREGEDCLAKNTESLLKRIQLKYDEYGITDKPYVVIKADQGTYGMGIMVVSSAEELRKLNRKQRTSMSTIKEGGDTSEVILQEGVPTRETWGENRLTAEPVVYMIDHYVVGGFYRMHSKKSATDNLNSPGMSFQPLAFAEACNTPDPELDEDASPNRFYAYGVIGRLALLAAAREIEESKAE